MPLGRFNFLRNPGTMSRGSMLNSALGQGMDFSNQNSTGSYIPSGLQRFVGKMGVNPGTMPPGVERFFNRRGLVPPQAGGGQLVPSGAVNPPISGVTSPNIMDSAQTKPKTGIREFINRFKSGGAR